MENRKSTHRSVAHHPGHLRPENQFQEGAGGDPAVPISREQPLATVRVHQYGDSGRSGGKLELTKFIRKEIAFNLKKYDPIEEGKEHEAVRAVFQPIQRIAEASIEIEKLINIFMTNFSD